MIIGYFPYDVEENLWQYIGTNIFLGTGLESDKLAFNEESIEKILFTGYSDAQGELYRKELAEAMESVPLGTVNRSWEIIDGHKFIFKNTGYGIRSKCICRLWLSYRQAKKKQ